MSTDPVKACTYSLHDSLMVLAPKGWSQLELEVVRSGERLRLASLSTRGDGQKVPPPMPELGIVKEHEALRVGEAFDELVHHLSHQGKVWEGGRARVTRGPEHTDLALLGPGSSPLFLARLTKRELDQLIVTEPLLDALLGTERAFAQLQAGLGSPPAGSEILLGTYQPDSFIFTWNHHDEAVRKACAVDARPPGLSAFWRPALACDEGFARALCAHLIVALNARGLRTDGEAPRSFFAVTR